MRSRYSRWDGSQDPFSGELDIGEVIDEISDDLLAGMSPNSALRRLMQQGMRGMQGLQDLLERIRQNRRRTAQALNLEGPLSEIKEKLDEILSMERGALSEMDSEDARMRETNLDMLPAEPAQMVKELSNYRFASPEAQEKFDQLVKDIQQQILDSMFGQMAGAMQNMTPDQVARMREMLAELNEMIRKKEAGEPYDFPGFMARYGDFFPENPRTLEELLEALGRRMASMSRLLASLTPEQRRQLEEMAQAVMSDLDIAFQMDQLNQELRQLMPHLPWDQQTFGWGEEPMELSEALGAIEQMSDFEELEQSLQGDYAGASIDDVDEEKLRRALDESAVRDLRRLKQVEKALEDAGMLVNNKGQMELTARGARRIGERALVKMFEELKRERAGSHQSRDAGGLMEPTGATLPWNYGDVGEFAVQKTVFNAITRGERSPSQAGVKLKAEDFELIEAETRTRTATALLLDLSFSMPLRGHWIPAKRMALALHALIEGKYPQDYLYLIGFSNLARKLEPRDLTATGPLDRVYGTNMEHAFLLARRLLSEHPRATKQVIMVTDGEPTAHLTNDPYEPAFFSWPPVPETIHKTLAEAIRLASADVTLNIFMLEDSPGLVRFMEQLAQRTGGRIFQMTDNEVGRYIIRDYVRRHR